MPLHVRLERFRALNISVRNLQGQILGRVPGNATAERIEARLVEIEAIAMFRTVI